MRLGRADYLGNTNSSGGRCCAIDSTTADVIIVNGSCIIAHIIDSDTRNQPKIGGFKTTKTDSAQPCGRTRASAAFRRLCDSACESILTSVFGERVVKPVARAKV